MRVIVALSSLALAGVCAPAIAAKPAITASSKGVVAVDVGELRAGPGEAYVSRGRVYRGEAVRVLEASDTGEWVHVEAGALRGWLTARAVRQGVAKETPPTDAERDRRQTNYQYDASGRRRGVDGAATGSGEGLQELVPEDRFDLPEPPPPEAPQAPRAGTFRVGLGLGAASLAREFRAEVDPDSFLADLSASTSALVSYLTLEWRPLPTLHVIAHGRDSRRGTVKVRRSFDIEGGIIEIGTEAQEVGLDVLGRVSFGQFWVGGGLGGRYLRHAFRETAPTVVFLTTSMVGASAMVEAGAHLGALEMRTTVAYVHPLSIEQAPFTSGDPTGSGLELSAEVAYQLAPAWTLFANSTTSRLSVEYTGRGSHRDTVTAERPIAYDSATEDNALTGFAFGVRWSN